MTGRTGLIVIILSIFLALGLSYDYITPLWNPPDEELHFAYCEYIARNHSLPELQSNAQSMRVSQTFHPPLYYLIGSLFCSNKGKPIQEILMVSDGPGYRIIKHPKGETAKAASAYWVRLFTLCLSAITIYYIYAMMLTIFPGDIIAAAATALFAGTNPQFLHISASISNETPAATFSTLYLFALLQYSKHTVALRHTIVMGLILGGCLLSKTSTVFLLPVTCCVLVFFRFREWKNLLKDCCAVFGVAAVVSGWWYVKNWALLRTMQTSQPWFIRNTPLSVDYLQKVIDYTFTSFFGYFGSLQIPISTFHLLFYGGVLLLGAIGLCRLLIKRELSTFQFSALAILLFSLLGGIGIFVLLNIKYYAFLGKYLFVVIAPIATFTVVGLRALVPPRWRNQLFILLSVLMVLVNLDILFRVLKPAYAEPQVREGAVQPAFCCVSEPIESSTTIAQSFISSENNLCAVRIILLSKKPFARGNAVFSLFEAAHPQQVLHKIQLPLKEISGDLRYYFVFPPIQDSKNKEYLFSITLSPDAQGERIFTWYEAKDVYREGNMFLNGRLDDGDVYFSTYHFTGVTPYSPWEGVQETVLDQGLFVTVREMQFYYECSPEVRAKTVTHKKILQLEKALSNNKL